MGIGRGIGWGWALGWEIGWDRARRGMEIGIGMGIGMRTWMALVPLKTGPRSRASPSASAFLPCPFHRNWDDPASITFKK